jgi:carbonic anhydrase
MRILIAFLACSIAAMSASANETAPAAPKATPDSVKIKSDTVKSSEVTKQAESPTTSKKSEATEVDLASKIAERLAAVRLQQTVLAARAARARAFVALSKASPAVASKAVLVSAPPAVRSIKWGYDGEFGPLNWSKLNSDWAKCGSGDRQSPIDLRDGVKVDLEKISFEYSLSSFSVVDDGHTVQVSVGSGNYINIQNRAFELVQFHFHRPSEERINGKSFEMVIHLEHKDPEGRLAVIAIMLERGKASSLIQAVWNSLPLEKNDVVSPSLELDLNDLLPERRDYFTYMGSLTTPPCSEGVLWMVMKQPMTASPAQIALFSRLYPFNARPIQKSAGRMIKESN